MTLQVSPILVSRSGLANNSNLNSQFVFANTRPGVILESSMEIKYLCEALH
jgi:hypothetical protein